jgi:CRISPR-associated exonuclease Cas4
MGESANGRVSGTANGDPELETEALVFQVTDLKQYTYCPRVVFFAYCLPLIRPMTYKMEAGIAAHEKAEEQEQRRSLRRYGLTEGERFFDLWLASEALGLRGRVDMAIRTATEAIPVEYKNSPGRAGRHLKLQLAAYGQMLEEAWRLPVRRGFLYFVPLRRAKEVKLTLALRREVEETVAAMRCMVEREAMPGPPRSRRPCVACEFRLFCNDL